MSNEKPNTTKTYFIAMTIFWGTFGLITLFSPSLMNMFQTETGISSVTEYSNHIWQHDGFDILAICVLFLALSRERVSSNVLKASAVVALLVATAITFSLLGSPYWNMLFVVPGVCCLGFAVWGFRLAGKAA